MTQQEAVEAIREYAAEHHDSLYRLPQSGWSWQKTSVYRKDDGTVAVHLAASMRNWAEGEFYAQTKFTPEQIGTSAAECNREIQVELERIALVLGTYRRPWCKCTMLGDNGCPIHAGRREETDIYERTTAARAAAGA